MDKYKWDLSKIFKDEKEFYDTLKKIEINLTKLSEYKGHILDSKNSLYEFYTLDDETGLLCDRVYVYSYLGYYDNTSDVKFQEYKEKATSIVHKYSTVVSFVIPELQSKEYEYVLKLIDGDSRFDKYRFSLENIYRFKKHVLSSEEEKLLSEVSNVFSSSHDAFVALNNTDVTFDNIKDENNKSVKLTSSNYSKYITSKDERVRKDAFSSLIKFYKKHINTIGSLYLGQVKVDSICSKVRKYESSISSSLFNDNISVELYDNLIKCTVSNLDILKKYYDIKSRVLGKKLHIYDTYVNISSLEEKNISFEEGVELVNKALKVLGEDYLCEFNNIINSNCVDVYPKDNKRSGAYEWGTYGVSPYVSLNYENNIESVSTLAHEMGHAMHTYYSNLNQDYNNANYPIFLAEIASTVNEVLLSEYLISNTSDIDEKIYYLNEFIDKFKGTVFRQVMFATFEKEIHEKYENNEAITPSVLCDEYYKLNQLYFSPSVIVDDDIKYEWARIPHFYSSFYVYKYATGFISALVIASKLINNESGFRDKYIKFLSSGGSDYPLDILKELGIDLNDYNTINGAFDILKNKVDLLQEYLDRKGV